VITIPEKASGKVPYTSSKANYSSFCVVSLFKLKYRHKNSLIYIEAQNFAYLIAKVGIVTNKSQFSPRNNKLHLS
jgi:hypothetical protein